MELNMTVEAKDKPRIEPSEVWQRFGTLGILVILVALCGALSPQYFLTTDNLVQVLLQSSVLILLACGVFFSILIAGIDLSVGSMLALTGMVTAQLMMAGCPPWLAGAAGRRAARRAARGDQRLAGQHHAVAPVHHHAGHDGDLPRADADHLRCPLGVRLPAGLLGRDRRPRAGRAGAGADRAGGGGLPVLPGHRHQARPQHLRAGRQCAGSLVLRHRHQAAHAGRVRDLGPVRRHRGAW